MRDVPNKDVPNKDAPKPTYRDVPKLAYSVREAVHATSLSKSQIYNFLQSGRLTSVKIGARTVIPAESLEALISGKAA